VTIHCAFLTAVLTASPGLIAAQTTEVAAEITGGSLEIENSPSQPLESFDVTGPGVHFVSRNITGNVDSCAAPGCRPGERFRVITNFSGAYMGVGLAVADGVTVSPAYFVGRMSLTTEEVAIPARGFRRHLILTVPFTLGEESGPPGAVLFAYDRQYAEYTEEVPPVIAASLTGSGTATLFFERVREKSGKGPGVTAYQLVRVSGSFSAPPPVP